MTDAPFGLVVLYTCGVAAYVITGALLFAFGVTGWIHEERTPLINTALVGAALLMACLGFAALIKYA